MPRLLLINRTNNMFIYNHSNLWTFSSLSAAKPMTSSTSTTKSRTCLSTCTTTTPMMSNPSASSQSTKYLSPDSRPSKFWLLRLISQICPYPMWSRRLWVFTIWALDISGTLPGRLRKQRILWRGEEQRIECRARRKAQSSRRGRSCSRSLQQRKILSLSINK